MSAWGALIAVIAIGPNISVGIARQQNEAGLIFGMGLATGAATAYADGLPRLADCPESEVKFIDSDCNPGALRELGRAATVSAIANSLFVAGDPRLHTMPLTAEHA